MNKQKKEILNKGYASYQLYLALSHVKNKY